jgi:hypothetical protein
MRSECAKYTQSATPNAEEWVCLPCVYDNAMSDQAIEQLRENIVTQLAQQATSISVIKHILIKTGVVDKDQLADIEREAAKTLDAAKDAVRAELSRT